MKKLTAIILCVTCISAVAIAQTGVRIGNMEFVVQKVRNDTLAQITVDEPCPPCPPETETRTRTNSKERNINVNIFDGYLGVGFILPDNGIGYYDLIGGSSWNLDIGREHRYRLSRRFAVGGLAQYSFYNYKLRPQEPAYLGEVTGAYSRDNIRKQVFRSHNIAAGIFARFYLSPPKSGRKTGGVYIDAGVQGDFAFSKYCKIKTKNPDGKDKYRDGYAFNPFTASVNARLGIGRDWAVFARYRFTDAFNKKELPMDLSPLTIGIQFF